MTILAGIVSRDSLVHVPNEVCDTIKRSISRDPSDQPLVFRDSYAFLIKIDIGAFGPPAHHISPSGSFAMLAGEPLLTNEGLSSLERDTQLEFLHHQWDIGDFQGLRFASGTFCAVYYNPLSGTVQLIADRLGLRPLYYAVDKNFVYFSSALRILENIREIPKKMDISAIMEIVGFGYPFGAGTPYAGIKVLLPSEIVAISRTDVASSFYFNWDSIPPSHASEESELKEIYEKFRAAVGRRLRGDKTTFAYLSGGLDSRCTVAALRSEGVHVSTFNFSLANTQDQVFGLEFARKIGAIHHEVPTEPGPNWSVVMADTWQTTSNRTELGVERPHLVWTGEGGSVGLGHVYLTPEIVSLLGQNNWDEAIEIFLRQQKKRIPIRVLDPKLAVNFHSHLHSRLRSELDTIHHPDPVRAFYIFLNLNGPRHHLVKHFETIDQHRLEFQLPFYDSEFLEYITATAAEPYLYHQLYVKWLSYFDPAVLAVPWQAYPGHVPSPVPIPENIPDQWSASASISHKKAIQSDLLKLSAEMLRSSGFPSALLRKNQLRLMWWATRFKLRDYSYAIKAAKLFFDYWQRCR